MAEKIMVFLSFIIIVFFIGSAIWTANRFNEIEKLISLERVEINEIKKKQRLTAQDVDFLEKLVIEGSER